MAQLAPNYDERQEFWKPAVAPRQEAVAAETTDQVCQECGTDFVLGSRFCYVCGADRNANLGATPLTGLRAWIDFASLRDALGQSYASLVALVMGFACVIAAIVTGFCIADAATPAADPRATNDTREATARPSTRNAWNEFRRTGRP